MRDTEKLSSRFEGLCAVGQTRGETGEGLWLGCVYDRLWDTPEVIIGGSGGKKPSSLRTMVGL